MTLEIISWFPDQTGDQTGRDSYLLFFPVAPIKVIDLHNHVILFSREPLHSDALVRKPGHWAQNVITEQKATESDKVFT